MPALDHDWSGEWKTVKEASCKETGLKEKTCANDGCNEKKTDTIDKLTTHTPVEAVTENKKAATCKAEGGYVFGGPGLISDATKAKIFG